MLTSGDMKFTPAIPAIMSAANQIAMGPVVKIILQFREPVWESDEELKRLSFVHSREQAVPTWWTSHPLRHVAGERLGRWARGGSSVASAARENSMHCGRVAGAHAAQTGQEIDELARKFLGGRLAGGSVFAGHTAISRSAALTRRSNSPNRSSRRFSSPGKRPPAKAWAER